MPSPITKPRRQPRKQLTPRRSKSAVLQSLRDEEASESSDEDYQPETPTRPNEPAIKAAVSLQATSTPQPRRGTRARQAPTRFGDPLRHAIQTIQASPPTFTPVPEGKVEMVECSTQTDEISQKEPATNQNPFTEMVGQIQACRKKLATANYKSLQKTGSSETNVCTEDDVEKTIQEHERYLEKLPKLKLSQVIETIRNRDPNIREPVVPESFPNEAAMIEWLTH